MSRCWFWHDWRHLGESKRRASRAIEGWDGWNHVAEVSPELAKSLGLTQTTIVLGQYPGSDFSLVQDRECTKCLATDLKLQEAIHNAVRASRRDPNAWKRRYETSIELFWAGRALPPLLEDQNSEKAE